MDLQVPVGSIFGFLGRNGAGKTTTLRSLMGLTPPREGRVAVFGANTTGWSPYRVAELGDHGLAFAASADASRRARAASTVVVPMPAIVATTTVTIPKVALPRKDPVYGRDGPLTRLWRRT